MLCARFELGLAITMSYSCDVRIALCKGVCFLRVGCCFDSHMSCAIGTKVFVSMRHTQARRSDW